MAGSARRVSRKPARQPRQTAPAPKVRFTGKFGPERLALASVGTGKQPKRLDANPDIPDIRDRIYEPPLLDLRTRCFPSGNVQSPILDQGTLGSCTGFALGTVVNLLLNQRLTSAGLALRTGNTLVSPRMLYEMAKIHDEWPGEGYEGSSIRGALKGFYHNGVCTLTVDPYDPMDPNWRLTVPRAKDARNVGLGAYYRLRPQMIDYHAAINQTGCVYISAEIHEGWQDPPAGRIVPNSRKIGGHAFVIVGYDDEGFLIQNSWGTGWGGFNGWPGIAHWSYEDWAKTVYDAWVLRLAVPTPAAFDLTHVSVDANSASGAHFKEPPEPRRDEILGHFAHIDDGKFVETGRYASSFESVVETARYLSEDATAINNYRHLLIYAHGGLNNEGACARRIVVTKEGYKRNGIYPFHFMWETGFAEELGDVLGIKFAAAQRRVGGAPDFVDWSIEKLTRGLGLPIWREMKRDAERAFVTGGAGTATLKTLLEANAKLATPRQIHFVGHSAGAILIAEMLAALNKINGGNQQLATVSLMAPACTMDVYGNAYAPALKGAKPRIKTLRQYNLSDSRELDDAVLVYGKSLLYLVRNAYEDVEPTELLGMEIASGQLKLPGNHKIFYAGRDSNTDSKSHGGFDSDRATLNDILESVTGAKPKLGAGFQANELIGLAQPATKASMVSIEFSR